MKRNCTSLSLVGALLLAFGPVVLGQDTVGQQRKQFVSGLLKTLIDTQLSPSEDIPSNQSRPKAQLDRTTSPKIREASYLLAAAAEEMSQLVGALQADLYRVPAVRSLLGQALNLNANATVLSRQLSRDWSTDDLVEELKKLDQDWRLLEHRLGQLEGLSTKSLGHIEKVRQYEQRLAELFDVPPQVDFAELARHASSLVGELRHLMEDIQMAVSDPNQANRLLLKGQDVDDRARRFAQSAAATASYQTLRTEYDSFQQAWSAYAPDLRPVTDRYVQRQVQRIQATDRNHPRTAVAAFRGGPPRLAARHDALAPRRRSVVGSGNAQDAVRSAHSEKSRGGFGQRF